MSRPEEQGSQAFSFVEAEHKILSFWKEKKIFEKSLEQTRAGVPYIFYDGPPFATGLPHHGHLVGGTLKDVIPRFFTMKGRYVHRRFGWDCHGLPIENEIDKKLGMSALDAVKKIGVKGYNDECRGIVSRYTKEWRKTVERMGRWVDFDNDYKTMDASYMESVWWVFKQLWDKNLIYEGSKVVPYSTALHTSLSNFEASLNYKDVVDQAITVLFKLKDEDASIAVWTTTPWTLPSNLCLCAGAEIDYVLVKDTELNKKYYLAKSRLEYYGKKKNLEILKELKGKDLHGRPYVPLFPYFVDKMNEGCFVILNDDYVTTDSGTGVVHIAPGFGEDDHRVMKEAKLNTMVVPLDPVGRFTEEISDFVGVYIKDADKDIIKKIKELGLFLEMSSYKHSYPFCYRTDTPLIYKAVPSWYVRVESIREKMMKNNAQINWVPEHLREGRFGKWLENARDWAISRTRVWGNPLPIWINDVTGSKICFGSREELKAASGKSIEDLHRENVDDITFSKIDEAGVYRRIPDVLDCWFESGSMPYAQLHYPFENKDVFKHGFPGEFIAEGLDQTRGWFYTLTVLASALFDKPAFKNVIVNGIVLAADGRKMSKSLRNYTPPDDLMESFGADALRLSLVNSGLVRAEDMRFSDDAVKEMARRALLPWYNSFRFFMTYAQVDGWHPQQHSCQGENILDRWLISRLQTLIAGVNSEMEAYHLYNVVPELFKFIEDLTNWYIRLNRRRFWEEGLEQDKREAYSALYTTLVTLSKLMAPIAPFFSEYSFLELKKLGGEVDESVHLCRYPEANTELIDPTLEDAVGRMAEVILLGRQKRIAVKAKVKMPLSRLTVIHKDQVILSEIGKLETYIKSELNVKNVEYSTDEERFISLFAKPNSPVLGKKLGKKFAEVTKAIIELKSSLLVKVEAGERIEVCGEDLGSDELLIFREGKAGTQALSNRFITIDMDTTIDDDLMLEGLAREIISRIQKTRKESSFNVADRIRIFAWAEGDLLRSLQKHADYIKGETLGLELELMPTRPSSGFVEQEIEDELLLLKIER